MAWKSASHKTQLQSSLFAQIHEDFVQYVILVPNSTFLEQLRDAAPVDVGDLCLYIKER